MNSHIIKFKEISDIVNAFQIASGQGFAIRKTKEILSLLSQGNIIIVEDMFTESKSSTISDVRDFAELIKSIDQFVDIENDTAFQDYF